MNFVSFILSEARSFTHPAFKVTHLAAGGSFCLQYPRKIEAQVTPHHTGICTGAGFGDHGPEALERSVNGCLGMLKGISPVEAFDLDTYLGRWFSDESSDVGLFYYDRYISGGRGWAIHKWMVDCELFLTGWCRYEKFLSVMILELLFICIGLDGSDKKAAGE